MTPSTFNLTAQFGVMLVLDKRNDEQGFTLSGYELKKLRGGLSYPTFWTRDENKIKKIKHLELK